MGAVRKMGFTPKGNDATGARLLMVAPRYTLKEDEVPD